MYGTDTFSRDVCTETEEIYEQKKIFDFHDFHHHHFEHLNFFISPAISYLFCELEHGGGDDVVVIMYASVRCDGYGYVHSKGGNMVRRVDRALYVDIVDCWHIPVQMIHLMAEELWGCWRLNQDFVSSILSFDFET